MPSQNLPCYRVIKENYGHSYSYKYLIFYDYSNLEN